MKKYVERIQEFEAIEYIGTKENAEVIIDWAIQNYGAARLTLISVDGLNNPGLELWIKGEFMKVCISDFVVLCDREFSIIDYDVFIDTYVEVEEPEDELTYKIMADNEVIRMGEGT